MKQSPPRQNEQHLDSLFIESYCALIVPAHLNLLTSDGKRIQIIYLSKSTNYMLLNALVQVKSCTDEKVSMSPL